jgi:phosphatidylserine/phosphatidylglycerophosphate/cardiolipin synthase-like enzyme
MTQASVLNDQTTGSVSEASRASLLIDMEAYFDAAMDAMRSARHTVHLLNWAFEAQTHFHPEAGGGGAKSDRIGDFLKSLAERPGLEVRILCWYSVMPVAATQHFFPFFDRIAFRGSKVKFVLDGQLPLGACHHQKMIVIDDAIAFCGGGDIGPDRWDTPEHLDDNPRREKTRRDNKCFDSRHEVMGLVDGPAAQALGDVFRDRWEAATGETLEPSPAVPRPAWPGDVPPAFETIGVGVSRTRARWRKRGELRENEALHVAAIRAATTCIYMENQYFTAPLIAEELAKRLQEADGPEVVLITTEHSPSYFDQMTMDRTRLVFLKTLQDADKHGRFRIYSPVTTLGRTIIVHAKLTIIDDTLMRIGSSNINNRSMGYDTECDLSLEAVGPGSAKNRAEIIRLRDKLLAHWLGCLETPFQQAVAEHGGVGAALEALRLAGHCRLRPIAIEKLNPVEQFVADNHLGDPLGEYDAWWPWRRKRAVADRRKALKSLVVEAGKPAGARPVTAKSQRKRRVGKPT